MDNVTNLYNYIILDLPNGKIAEGRLYRADGPLWRTSVIKHINGCFALTASKKIYKLCTEDDDNVSMISHFVEHPDPSKSHLSAASNLVLPSQNTTPHSARRRTDFVPPEFSEQIERVSTPIISKVSRAERVRNSDALELHQLFEESINRYYAKLKAAEEEKKKLLDVGRMIAASESSLPVNIAASETENKVAEAVPEDQTCRMSVSSWLNNIQTPAAIICNRGESRQGQGLTPEEPVHDDFVFKKPTPLRSHPTPPQRSGEIARQQSNTKGVRRPLTSGFENLPSWQGIGAQLGQSYAASFTTDNIVQPSWMSASEVQETFDSPTITRQVHLLDKLKRMRRVSGPRLPTRASDPQFEELDERLGNLPHRKRSSKQIPATITHDLIDSDGLDDHTEEPDRVAVGQNGHSNRQTKKTVYLRDIPSIKNVSRKGKSTIKKSRNSLSPHSCADTDILTELSAPVSNKSPKKRNIEGYIPNIEAPSDPLASIFSAPSPSLRSKSSKVKSKEQRHAVGTSSAVGNRSSSYLEEPASPATDTDEDPDYDLKTDKTGKKKSVLARNVTKKECSHREVIKRASSQPRSAQHQLPKFKDSEPQVAGTDEDDDYDNKADNRSKNKSILRRKAPGKQNMQKEFPKHSSNSTSMHKSSKEKHRRTTSKEDVINMYSFKKMRTLTDNEDDLGLNVEWSKREIERYQNALITVDADEYSSDMDFWKAVSKYVKSKTWDECLDRYEAITDLNEKYKKLRQNRQHAKPSKQEDASDTENRIILAGKKTLKRKEQIYDMVQQINAGYSPTLYDTNTPIAPKAKKYRFPDIELTPLNVQSKASPDPERRQLLSARKHSNRSPEARQEELKNDRKNAHKILKAAHLQGRWHIQRPKSKEALKLQANTQNRSHVEEIKKHFEDAELYQTNSDEDLNNSHLVNRSRRDHFYYDDLESDD